MKTIKLTAPNFLNNYNRVNDENNNKLELHINSEGNLYINAGMIEDEYYSGYICLDKEDVSDLIEELKRLLAEM